MVVKSDDRLSEQSLELLTLFSAIPSERQREGIIEIVKAAAYPSHDPFVRPADPLPIET